MCRTFAFWATCKDWGLLFYLLLGLCSHIPTLRPKVYPIYLHGPFGLGIEHSQGLMSYQEASLAGTLGDAVFGVTIGA